MAKKPGGLQISFRPIGQDDWNYVLDSWKRSFRQHVGFHTPCYFSEISDRIERIIDAPGTEFTMAVDPDDDNFILGWVCHDGNVVHYAFTRQCFRRARVAKRLVAEKLDTAKPIITTSWTRACEAVNKRYDGALRYEPTRLEKGKRNGKKAKRNYDA